MAKLSVPLTYILNTVIKKVYNFYAWWTSKGLFWYSSARPFSNSRAQRVSGKNEQLVQTPWRGAQCSRIGCIGLRPALLRIIKNLHIFQTRWKTLAFTVINYIRELIAKKLDDNGIHSIDGLYWNKSWWCLFHRRNTYSERSCLILCWGSIDNGIHFLCARMFCRRPSSEVSASEQSRISASVEHPVLVHIRSM